MMGAEAVARSRVGNDTGIKINCLRRTPGRIGDQRDSDPIGRERHLGRATLRKEMDRLALLGRSNSRARHCKRSAHRFLPAQLYCRVTRSTRLQRCDFRQTYEIRQDAHRESNQCSLLS